MFAQQPAGAQGQGNLEEIVVTGSRIARRDFTSQSPIVTVDQEAFTSRSEHRSRGDARPAAAVQHDGCRLSGLESSAASTPFPQANAAPGAATINLRGLGLNRSLVLLDGRRAQPVNGYLVVDLNTIPSAAIDRVEVITGGAAAVYGADAIAGVVNFVSKKNFEGVQVDVQSGHQRARRRQREHRQRAPRRDVRRRPRLGHDRRGLQRSATSSSARTATGSSGDGTIPAPPAAASAARICRNW